MLRSAILISSLIYTLVFTHTGFAQVNEFEFGTMLGFYGVHVQGETDKVYSTNNGHEYGKGGISTGIRVQRDVSRSLHGALGLRYARKGSVYDFISSFGTKAFEVIKLDYLELPLTLGSKVYLGKTKPLLVEAGISYAVLLKSRILVSELNPWDPSNIENAFKHEEWGWHMSFKYAPFQSTPIMLALRVTQSIGSIHTRYNLNNFTYGIELQYIFN
jgi:hypothetical protein